MTSPNIEIDITLQDKRWHDAINDIDALVTNAVSKALHSRLNGLESVEISIVLADDTIIQELNKSYRNIDKPTNVLSFPITEPKELESPAAPFCALGDIIISYDTISREAEEQKKDVTAHFTHMLVHGCLHLLHYDHQDENEAEIMEKLEIEILSQLNVKNPYE